MLALKRLIPVLDWLPRYRRADLQGDLTAGLTTAVMLIPQGMAYAMLAGLPPIIGLYAAVIPVAVYALFGTSRELAVGPVAMVSLLVAAGVGGLAEPGSADYVAYAVLLSLLVGAIQLGMGLTRLGFLVNFLSHPVISGFTSAAALIIGFSQLKHLLGLDIPRSHHVHTIVLTALQQAGDIHLPTLLIGAGAVALLLGLKRWKPLFPAALAVVVLGSLAVWSLRLNGAGVAIVGTVPAGLPPLRLPSLDVAAIRELLPIALTISFVGFMESISVAKAFAARRRYDVDANQELVGLGLANLAGSAFQAYPVTGGFSRTAVNSQAGSRTPLASLITAGVIAVTLVLFTPLFYYLPKAVLAAIIMTAVFGLVDVREARHLWHVKRADLALLGLTFLATLTLGIEQGILAGVGGSLLWHFVRTTRPHTAVLGRLPGTEVYRNLKRYPQAEPVPELLLVRMDAQLYFGNVSFLKETLARLLHEAATPVRAVVLDASSVNHLDSSADTALHEVADDLARRGMALYLAGVKGPVLDVMRRSHLTERLGTGRFHHTVHEAVQHALAHAPAPPPADARQTDTARPAPQPSQLELGLAR